MTKFHALFLRKSSPVFFNIKNKNQENVKKHPKMARIM